MPKEVCGNCKNRIDLKTISKNNEQKLWLLRCSLNKGETGSGEYLNSEEPKCRNYIYDPTSPIKR